MTNSNCWISGEECPFGFGGILETKMSFCKECNQFLRNKAQIQIDLDDLELEKFSLLAADDQINILENIRVLRRAILKKLTSLSSKKLRIVGLEHRQNVSAERENLLFLNKLFQKYV